MKNLKLNLPVILQFNDYHEITYVLDQMNEIFNGKLKAEELEHRFGYFAIFYLTKDKEYKRLVKEWNIAIEQFNEEEIY